METEKVAILVDGGFYQRRAKALWGDRMAKERASELEAYCKNHLHFKTSGKDEYDSLYRIFYYDCPPADNTVYHPLQKKNVNLRKSNLYSFMDLARFLCDYSSDDLRVQSSGDMSGSFLQ